MAYVLGFFAADGYITVNKRGAHFWCIQITDRQLLLSIKHILQAEHIISARPHKKKHKTLFRLQIGSKEMCNDLRRLGFSERKTKNLSIPQIPNKYFCHFVRGYFDGDGNVWLGYVHTDRKKPSLSIRVMFTSGSVDFLKMLHVHLRPGYVLGGSLYVSKKNYARLQFAREDSLKLYECMYNKCHPELGDLYLKRKKKIFERYINCGHSSIG